MDSTTEDDPPPAYTTSITTTNSFGRLKKRTTGSSKSVSKRLVKIVKSVGGLAALLLAYTFLGAWLMMTIEGPVEDSQIKETGIINSTEWEHQTNQTLVHFEQQVHRSGVSSTSRKKWTFFGAVLFCFTTYTTIGYGNIAPATKVGRIATMLYATLGIPIALIVLADLGHRFTVAFKFIWSFIRRYYYTGYCRKMRDRVHKISINMKESKAVGDCEQDADGLDIMRASSYRKVDRADNHTQTDCRVEKENGCGDGRRKLPDRKETEDKMAVEEVPERSQTSQRPLTEVSNSMSQTSQRPATEVSHSTSEDKAVVDQTEPQVFNSKSSEEPQISVKHTHSHAKADGLNTDLADADYADIYDEFKLPVPVAIGFIFAYIFLGAGMYTLWEDWTYLESFYFVFITTSTIGFGDVLPEHPNFFLLSCVYTFLGLALVSMTVNVIVEFMTKTIDRAKHSVDHATEKAVAKAKAAKGMLSQVSSRAKNKVRKTISGHRGKTKKAKRSSVDNGIEIRDSSGRSDSESESAEIAKDTDTGLPTSDLSQPYSGTANVTSQLHIGTNTHDGHVNTGDETVLPLSHTNTLNADKIVQRDS